MMLNTIFLFRFIWTKNTRLRRLVVGLCLSGFSILYLLLFLELCFRTCVTFSDGVGISLASSRWFEKYWHPINSLGYRDVEHELDSFNGKQLLFVVGDSITAGYGIENYQDRFANRLAQELGAKWIVAVIAKPGWDTKHEIDAIRSYPHKPDMIILSYYINDIIGVASAKGYKYTGRMHAQPTKYLRWIIDRSHLFNFVYWRYRLAVHTKTVGPPFWAYLQDCFETEEVWRPHASELLDLVSYVNQHGIRLGVVIWPHPPAVDVSEPAASKVAALFSDAGIPVLDLVPHLKDRSPSTLIVNRIDGHPNVAIHAEVAQLLIDRIDDWAK